MGISSDTLLHKDIVDAYEEVNSLREAIGPLKVSYNGYNNLPAVSILF